MQIAIHKKCYKFLKVQIQFYVGCDYINEIKKVKIYGIHFTK